MCVLVPLLECGVDYKARMTMGIEPEGCFRRSESWIEAVNRAITEQLSSRVSCLVRL